MTTLNKISDKLRDEALNYLKERGTVRYEILGKKIIDGRVTCKFASRVLSKDTIYDPYLEKRVEIGYVKDYRSAPDGSNRDVIPTYGDITFYNSDAGFIKLNWDNPDDHEQHVFMYLCRWNQSNVDKPWHSKPRNNKYMFWINDPEAESRRILESAKRRDRARVLLHDLSDNEIFALHESLFPGQKSVAGINTLRRKLLSIADREPDSIVHLHENEKLEIMRLIKDLERNKIAFYDAKTRHWRRSDGETKIAKVGEMDDRYDVFYRAMRVDETLRREMKTYLLTALESRGEGDSESGNES